VVIITNVELDHVEYLGNTLAAIASEKAGVFKPRRPVISGVVDPSARAIIRARAQECQAELLEIGTIGEFTNVRASEGRYTFDLTVGREHFARLRAPLTGKFQIMNTAAAVLAASRLVEEGFEIPRRCIAQGLRDTVWRGRLEQLLPQPLVLLDGAHNPAAAQALAAFVRDELAGRRLRLVYASMRDKAIREIGAILFPLAAEVYLTAPDHPRAAKPEEILATVAPRPSPVLLEPVPARALERACAASEGTDVVLVAGSLYLVGAIKQAQREKSLQLPGLTGAPR
jgi:dihydrofolate synthase/folylpolyglutamate synthase